MSIYQIITLLLGGGATVKIWEYAIKWINRKAENKKTEAEASVLQAEADVLVADTWQKLFKEVNAEWHLAMAAIKKSTEDIEELKKMLEQEKIDCQEKMTILYQQIQALKLNQK